MNKDGVIFWSSLIVIILFIVFGAIKFAANSNICKSSPVENIEYEAVVNIVDSILDSRFSKDSDANGTYCKKCGHFVPID